MPKDVWVENVLLDKIQIYLFFYCDQPPPTVTCCTESLHYKMDRQIHRQVVRDGGGGFHRESLEPEFRF